MKALESQVQVVPHDPEWPRNFERISKRINSALGDRALRLEHVGSTSVPDLPAKPIIDVLLVVADSANESEYVPILEGCGYLLRIREPLWYEHRMLKNLVNSVNVHVFSKGCEEIDRMISFRDWLRLHAPDRELYARTKQALAQREWKYIQNYADAKTEVIEEILARMRNERTAVRDEQ